MIPQIGQQVRCFMRSTTAIVLEGSVQEWNKEQIVIQTLDNHDIVIVHNPQDIMLTRIISSPQTTISTPDLEEVNQNVQKKLNEIIHDQNDPELRNKNIKELQQLAKEQDKKIISEKTKEHFGSSSNPKLKQYNSQYSTLSTKKV